MKYDHSVELSLANLGALTDLVEDIINPKKELMPDTVQAIGVLLRLIYNQLSESIKRVMVAE